MRVKLSQNGRRSPAFTLIELLVVIAVIGVLAALLLPVLASAKNKAAQTADINNLKQQTTALHLFANDNEDKLPWPNWDYGDGTRPGWLYALDVSAQGPARFKLETGLFWTTLQNPKLYLCPLDRPTSTAFGVRPQQISSYVMNGAVIGYDRVLDTPLKLSAMPPTACVLWEADESHSDSFNDGSSFPSEGLSARHSHGGIQATFFGSVSRVRQTDWNRNVNDPNRNTLWCYPDSPDGR